MRLLAISGSLRSGSYNSALLRAAAAVSPEGLDFAIWRELADIPPFNEDLQPSSAVESLSCELARAGAVLFATPEYNSSIPGALKNALDWVSQPLATNPLRGKTVAVIGASQGLFGAVWAQAELRKILTTMGARVDERELPVARAHEAFTEDGALRDPTLEAKLRAVVVDLAEGMGQLAA